MSTTASGPSFDFVRLVNNCSSEIVLQLAVAMSFEKLTFDIVDRDISLRDRMMLGQWHLVEHQTKKHFMSNSLFVTSTIRC